MTDSYYRDLLALYKLIKAASSSSLDPKTQKGLADLQSLVDQAEKDAAKVDSGAQAVRDAHEALDQVSGWRSAKMETQLYGLEAARLGHERPALEYVIMMIGVENSSVNPFVNGLQKALGKGLSPERTKAAKALASTATQTGKAADSFCTNLLKPTGGGDSNPLIYSALLALRAVIDSKLSEETRRIIDNLILHLPHGPKESTGGAKPAKHMKAMKVMKVMRATAYTSTSGGCYWPKCYVTSCSCSKAPA